MSVLARGLVLLDHLAESGEAGGAELSRRVGIDPSQVHRALRVLQRGGYVEQDARTKKYRLASRVVELASSYLKRVDIRAEARPVLVQLQEATAHTAHLAILSRHYSVIIDQERGPSANSLDIVMGDMAPLHATALGKVLLAYLDASTLGQILTGLDYAPLTAHTVQSEASLRAQLGGIRTQGYATDQEEAYRGVCCVAAPVCNWTGKVIAALSVSGPSWAIDQEYLPVLAQRVLAAADALSQRLGHRVPSGPSPDGRPDPQDERSAAGLPGG
jgi:DNA-binding IclR family transcriptional regulator